MPREPAINLSPGDKIAQWTIVKKVDIPAKPGKRKYSRHICRCSCGAEHIVLTHSLLDGSSTQCLMCRGRHHGDRVRVEGELVAFKLPPEYKAYLHHRFGEGRAVGRGVREAIRIYRKSGVIKNKGDHLRGSRLKPTSAVIPMPDKIWLRQNHSSIVDGILSAIDYCMFNQ